MDKLPVIDMHCDMPVYLLMNPGADPNEKDFGASFPYLREGNVKLQVMALYTGVEEESSVKGPAQAALYKQLLQDYPSGIYQAQAGFDCQASDKIGMVAAIESASGICNETEPLDNAFTNLEKILADVDRLFYISFTHHYENRFGGGNYAEAGLKPDGEVLLDYMSGKQIAIDLSHTSRALAQDILDYTYKKGLDVPVIASHSNFKDIWDHPRNLTKAHAEEIIRRGGLIGMNFLRAFVDNDRPETLLDHMAYAVTLEGGEDALCFGADFFFVGDFPDPARDPYYFAQHEDATKYHALMEALGDRLSAGQKEKMACKNVERFIAANWH